MVYTQKCPDLFETLIDLVIRTVKKENISEIELNLLPRNIYILSKLLSVMRYDQKIEEECIRFFDMIAEFATAIANKETTSETELKVLPEVVDSLVTMMITLRHSSMTSPLT